jgi:ribA/ribD-fused uncharacterized protein
MNDKQIINFEQRIKEIAEDLLFSARSIKIVDENVLMRYYSILDDIIKELKNDVYIDRLLAGKISAIYQRLRDEADHSRGFPRIREIVKDMEVYIGRIFDESLKSSIKTMDVLKNELDIIYLDLATQIVENKVISQNTSKNLISILEEMVEFFRLEYVVDRSIVGKTYKCYFLLYLEIVNSWQQDSLFNNFIEIYTSIKNLLPYWVSFGIKDDAYNCFSNFSKHSFVLKNKQWKTVSHYFQSMKFENTPLEEKIRLTNTPEEAEKIGKNRELSIRKGWKDVKVSIMREAVLEKFKSNENIKTLLISTRDEVIRYNNNSDDYWGRGQIGNGQNELGKILMEVREMLKGNENK